MSRWLVLFLPLFLIACKEQKKEQQKNQNALPYTFDYSKFEGVYKGDFNGSSLSLILDHVSGKHATGYNLHKGLRRNVSGKMSFTDSSFQFTLNEPGDHKYDGIFQFTIDTLEYKLKGIWEPLNNDSLKTKTLLLSKMNLDGDDYHNVYSDSIGVVYFNPDGLCRFEDYPIIDGQPAEQMIEVEGTWKMRGNDYIVDWEPNDYFPDRRSVFIAEKESDIVEGYYGSIKLGERTLYSNFF